MTWLSSLPTGVLIPGCLALALLAARAFRTSSRAALSRRWWLVSFALVAAQ